MPKALTSGLRTTGLNEPFSRAVSFQPYEHFEHFSLQMQRALRYLATLPVEYLKIFTASDAVMCDTSNNDLVINRVFLIYSVFPVCSVILLYTVDVFL